MASDDEDHTATVYGEEDFIEEDEEEDVDLIDEDEDDDEEDNSTSSAAGEVTIAVAGVPNVSTPVAVTPVQSATVRSEPVEAKKPLDDSRRLFQRLWTDEDEIELLQGFLDYTTQRGTSNSHHHDTTAFYDQIKGKLQLEFNKNQLVEKLRRLKKKYRNVLAKTSSGKEYVFKSPHDQATFDLCCKIWSEPAAAAAIDDDEPQNPNPSLGLNLNDNNGNGIGSGDPNSSEKKVPRPRKRARSSAVKIEENYNQPQFYAQATGAGLGSGTGTGTGTGTGASNSNAVNAATANLVEETVKSCLLPLFKELVNNSPNGASRGFGLGLGIGLGGMNFPIGDMSDEKWRKQHILELEVYSKRLELMQDQIKSSLEELRSMGNS